MVMSSEMRSVEQCVNNISPVTVIGIKSHKPRLRIHAIAIQFTCRHTNLKDCHVPDLILFPIRIHTEVIAFLLIPCPVYGPEGKCSQCYPQGYNDQYGHPGSGRCGYSAHF